MKKIFVILFLSLLFASYASAGSEETPGSFFGFTNDDKEKLDKITVTGGSTGDVLAQQEDGSFAPTAPAEAAGAMMVEDYDTDAGTEGIVDQAAVVTNQGTLATMDAPPADDDTLYGMINQTWQEITSALDWTQPNQGTIDPTNYVDNDTVLSEAQVDAYADDNGYLESETDPDFTTWLSTFDPFETADETDPGFAAWLLATPPLYSEVDGSTTNEINTITGDNAASTSGLAITVAGAGTVATAVAGNTLTITGTGDGTGTDDQLASEVPVTTTAFNGHLANDSTSDTVQKCLDLLDDIVGGNSITNLTVTSSTSPSITGNTIIDNSGQSGSITTTMPACPSETMFVQFIITTPAYTWYIEPATDENFYLNGTEFDANHMIVNNGAAAIFQDSVMFMSKEDASSNWVWIVYTIQGTWTDGGL